VRRLTWHRPSAAATVISLIALCVAMGGSAVAATGGTFILGKANTASSVSSLTNTKGTALSLSSSSKAPPLKVSNGVQVPKLNASELDGHTSSAFLPAGGTAVNSDELGAVPASDYMYGSGTTTVNIASLTGFAQVVLLRSPGAELEGFCEPSLHAGSAFYLQGVASAATGQTAAWWNQGGVAGNDALVPGAGDYVSSDLGTTTPFMVEVQVSDVSTVSTFTGSEWYDSSTQTCHFTGQVVTVKV
jgi:hypothetical protein